MAIKYLEIRDHLRRRIETMSVGDPLPPEHILCEEYGASRITLRKAIDGLVDQDLLVREQGRGTFVSQPMHPHRYSESFNHRIGGFYSEMAERGHEVGSAVLTQRVIGAPPRIAELLGLAPASTLVELVRLRTVDGAPNHIVHTFLPADRFAAVAENDFNAGSLYEFLRRDLGVELARARLSVSIGQADADEAEQLDVPADSPLLVVESTVYDPGGDPLLFGFSRLRPDVNQVEFEVVSQADQEPS